MIVPLLDSGPVTFGNGSDSAGSTNLDELSGLGNAAAAECGS